MLRPNRTLRVPVKVGKETITLVCKWPVAELLTESQWHDLALGAGLRASGQEQRTVEAAQREANKQHAKVLGWQQNAPIDPQALLELAAYSKMVLQGMKDSYAAIGPTLCRLVVAQVNEAGEEEVLRLCETLEGEVDGAVCVQQLGNLPSVWATLREVYLAEVTPFPKGTAPDRR